jgi:hypothetical protein
MPRFRLPAACNIRLLLRCNWQAMLELEGTSASTFGAGKTETGRHDAHHDVALAVQQDRATEHLCVGAELPLPEAMGQDDCFRAFRLVFDRQVPTSAAGPELSGDGVCRGTAGDGSWTLKSDDIVTERSGHESE